MQTKLRFSLYMISVFIMIAIIIGCIYEKKEIKHRTSVYKEIENDILKEDTKKIEIETDKEDDAQAVEPVSLGEFRLTGYCGCLLCCGSWSNNRPIDVDGNEIIYGAIGEELKEGYSIAVDPDIIPYRSKVIINGDIYEAQDCGGAIKGNRIDLYYSSHQDAIDHGVKYAEVFLIQEVDK